MGSSGSQTENNSTTAKSSSIQKKIANHRLLFKPDDFPRGNFVFAGMRAIRKYNPNIKIPENMVTWYGAINFEYTIPDNTTGKTHNKSHDVFGIAGMYFDLTPRDGGSSSGGYYGKDWLNVYFPLGTLKTIAQHINNATGFIVNNEGIYEDTKQSLASVSVRYRADEVPQASAFLKAENSDKFETIDLGDVSGVLADSGQKDLVGGVGFCSFGISTPVDKSVGAPVSGSLVKLSVKLRAIHVMHTTSGEIRRITYKSESAGLKY